MSKFLETYGVALFTLVLVAILIAFAGPFGMKIKNATTDKVSTTEEIGNDEIYVATTGRPKPPKTAVDKVWCYLDKNGELVISQNKVTAPNDALVKEKQLNRPSDILPSASSKLKIKTVRFDGTVMPKSCLNWFWSCYSLKEIKNIQNLYTNECTSMEGMFTGCKSLKSLDLSNFDTSNVTTMKSMFDSCMSLTSLDLSGFDTSKVKNTNFMFHYCSSLNNIDLSNFDTSKVTSMTGIFAYCDKLKSITAPQTVKDKILSFEPNACVPSGVTWHIN